MIAIATTPSIPRAACCLTGTMKCAAAMCLFGTAHPSPAGWGATPHHHHNYFTTHTCAPFPPTANTADTHATADQLNSGGKQPKTRWGMALPTTHQTTLQSAASAVVDSRRARSLVLNLSHVVDSRRRA